MSNFNKYVAIVHRYDEGEFYEDYVFDNDRLDHLLEEVTEFCDCYSNMLFVTFKTKFYQEM